VERNTCPKRTHHETETKPAVTHDSRRPDRHRGATSKRSEETPRPLPRSDSRSYWMTGSFLNIESTNALDASVRVAPPGGAASRPQPMSQREIQQRAGLKRAISAIEEADAHEFAWWVAITFGALGFRVATSGKPTSFPPRFDMKFEGEVLQAVCYARPETIPATRLRPSLAAPGSKRRGRTFHITRGAYEAGASVSEGDVLIDGQLLRKLICALIWESPSRSGASLS